MQMILDEARESYDPSIVQELRSDKYEDLEQNVARVCEWLENWKKEHSNESYRPVMLTCLWHIVFDEFMQSSTSSSTVYAAVRQRILRALRRRSTVLVL